MAGLLVLMAAAAFLSVPEPTAAAPGDPTYVYWTNWTSGSATNGYTAQGTLTTGSATVSVTYNNPRGIAFAQFNGGTDYWTPRTATSPYTSALVENPPTTSDIIALQFAGTQTLTFSQAIANPVFSYVSLNGNGYAFDRDFEILSFGHSSDGNSCGYWGCGTSFKQVVTLANGQKEYQLLGTGEPHGTIRFIGSFSTVTWRSMSNENWNGFTLGVYGTAFEVFPPEATIGPATASFFEDDAAASLQVTLSKAWTKPGLVNYTLSSSSATHGSDYVLASGTLPFAVGQTTMTLPLLLLNDLVQEAHETLTVSLTGARNATIASPSSSTVTILDDDEIPGADFLLELVNAGDTSAIAVTDNSSWTQWPVNAWLWAFGDGATATGSAATHNYATDGIYTVTLTATNEVGNSDLATAIHLVDRVPPLTTATVTCPPGTDGWCRGTATVSLSSFDVFGVSALLQRVDGEPFSPYTEAVQLADDGVHTVEFYGIDLVGNVEVVRMVEVKVDATSPTLSVTPSGTQQNGWYVTPVTLDLVATDATSGVLLVESRVNGGAWTAGTGRTVSTQGAVSFEARATDAAGNVVGPVAQAFQIDTAVPTASASVSGPVGQNGWHTGPVQVTVAGSDATSGIAALRLGLDGASLSTYAGPVAVSAEGTHSAQFQSVDAAALESAVGSLSFKIDSSLPTASATVSGTQTDGWFTSAATVSFAGSDAVSGVAAFQYRSPTLTSNGIVERSPGAGPVSFTTQGQHSLEVRARDVAGNYGLWFALPPFSIDLTPPTITVSPSDAGWHRTQSLSVSIVATDGPGVGLGPVQCTLDGTPVDCSTVTIVGEGIHSLAVTAVDLLGHQASVSRTFRLDGTPPSIALTLMGPQDENGTYVDDVTVSVSVSDGVSGVLGGSLVCRLDGAARTCPFTVIVNGPHSIVATVLDAAGNSATATASFVLDHDIDPPATTHALLGTQQNGWFRTPVTVRLTAVDARTPILATDFSLDGVAGAGPGRGTRILVTNVPVATQGWHTLAYQSSDLAGNTEDLRAAPAFRIDSLAPATTIGLLSTPYAGNLYADGVDVTFEAFDVAGGSGVASILYRVDGGSAQTWNGQPVRVGGTGLHTVLAWSVDVAGNVGGQVSASFGIDATAPTIESPQLLGEEGERVLEDGTPAFRSAVTIDLNAFDIGPAGLQDVATVEYRVCAPCDGVPYTLYGQPFLLDTEGRFNVHVLARDAAGHIAVLDFWLVIDLRTPVADLLLTTAGHVGTDTRLYLDGRICFNLPLEDPFEHLGLEDPVGAVAGINRIWYTIEDDVRNTVVTVNRTVNQLTGTLDLPLAISLHFCEDLADGLYTLYGGGCDAAGNCGGFGGGGFGFGIDTAGPTVEIVWPPAGTASFDDYTLPLLPTADECNATYRIDAAAAPVLQALCASIGGAGPAVEGLDPVLYESLRTRTILAGQVPVLVRASDAGVGVASVALDVGGTLVGTAMARDGRGYYAFVVDTTTLGAATDGLVPRAVTAASLDGLGHGAAGQRTMEFMAVDPHTELWPARPDVGMQP